MTEIQTSFGETSPKAWAEGTPCSWTRVTSLIWTRPNCWALPTPGTLTPYEGRTTPNACADGTPPTVTELPVRTVTSPNRMLGSGGGQPAPWVRATRWLA